jgi:hypothetical protein
MRRLIQFVGLGFVLSIGANAATPPPADSFAANMAKIMPLPSPDDTTTTWYGTMNAQCIPLAQLNYYLRTPAATHDRLESNGVVVTPIESTGLSYRLRTGTKSPSTTTQT